MALSARNSSPTELVWLNAQHNQGPPNTDWLQYIANNYGVEPDFSVTPQTLKRYVRFITSPQLGHIEFEKHSAEEEVRGLLSETAEIYHQERSIYRRKDKDEIAVGIARKVLSTETARLINGIDGTAEENKLNPDDYAKRVARIQNRTAQGQSSYLFYYGREGNTTGSREFDGAYQNVWQQIVQADARHSAASSVAPELVSKHNAAVLAAEIRFLGHTVLAQ